MTTAPTSAVSAGDRARLVRVERLLHLHRLEDDDEVAGLDDVALLDGDLDDRALHRRGERVAGRRGAGLLAGRALRRGLLGAAAAAADAPKPAGSETSSRLPPTSTTIVSRSSALGAVGRRRRTAGCVVELGLDPAGVHGERARAVNAGSRTTARWNGSAVAMPSTSNSSSARRARSSASSRVAPVTMSLASSESKVPPMTESARSRSRRARPDRPARGSVVTVPGAGRKARPGSSPLIRNSKRVAAQRRVVGEAQRLAVGDAELLAHQVDAR